MFPPTLWGWSQNTTFLLRWTDLRAKTSEKSSQVPKSPAEASPDEFPQLGCTYITPTPARTCLHALVPAGGLIFNTRVFLKSSIALHHNCQLDSQCYLPGLYSKFSLATPSIPSHKRFPALPGTDLKEHLSHQSCQFTSTAAETQQQYRG